MQLTENEREILQDLVSIEYNNDTTDLIEYRNKLARIHFKLTEEELNERQSMGVRYPTISGGGRSDLGDC